MCENNKRVGSSVVDIENSLQNEQKFFTFCTVVIGLHSTICLEGGKWIWLDEMYRIWRDEMYRIFICQMKFCTTSCFLLRRVCHLLEKKRRLGRDWRREGKENEKGISGGDYLVIRRGLHPPSIPSIYSLLCELLLF